MLPTRPRPRCPHLTWCQGYHPGRNGLGDHRGLRRLRLHLPRLRLSQGPAQGLRLSLEGTIALPGQPELEMHSWVGLPQQYLESGRARGSSAREQVAHSSLGPLPPQLTYRSVPPQTVHSRPPATTAPGRWVRTPAGSPRGPRRGCRPRGYPRPRRCQVG